MLKELSYVAKATNNVARQVLIGLVGSAAIFVVASYITPKLSGLVWMVAFIFIVASIYVYTRYVGSTYLYEIADVGTPSFVISLTVGKTSRTMARIDIDSITEVRRLTGKEYRKYKCEKGVVKYSYFPTMMPTALYLISMRSPYENADIFIEADESFAKTLSASADDRRNGYY